MTEEQSDAVHQRVLDLLAAEGVPIAASYICPHAPWDHCPCRKPSPLLLQRAQAGHAIDFTQSYIVGDKKSDIDLGHHTGCKTILYAVEPTKDNAQANPHFQSNNWSQIADWILNLPFVLFAFVRVHSRPNVFAFLSQTKQ